MWFSLRGTCLLVYWDLGTVSVCLSLPVHLQVLAIVSLRVFLLYTYLLCPKKWRWATDRWSCVFRSWQLWMKAAWVETPWRLCGLKDSLRSLLQHLNLASLFLHSYWYVLNMPYCNSLYFMMHIRGFSMQFYCLNAVPQEKGHINLLMFYFGICCVNIAPLLAFSSGLEQCV